MHSVLDRDLAVCVSQMFVATVSERKRRIIQLSNEPNTKEIPPRTRRTRKRHRGKDPPHQLTHECVLRKRSSSHSRVQPSVIPLPSLRVVVQLAGSNPPNTAALQLQNPSFLMSWTSTTGYSPTILKKSSSVGLVTGGGNGSGGSASSNASVGSNGVFGLGLESDVLANAEEQEVIVPLVLWDEPPQMEVSCLHVLHLPMSQPSQNSSTTTHASFVRRNSGGTNANKSSANLQKDAAGLSRQKSAKEGNSRSNSNGSTELAGLQIQIVDDDDEGDEAMYQVCVFAGTVDGVIVYWLFEHDAVVQVNMLLFSGEETTESSSGSGSSRSKGDSRQPVQGIISGTDEWGQSMLISVTRDGSVARWQLPNGMCSHASGALAKQLAPIKGMEMFCNNRYAMVYSEETRMMVLDTWKMNLLYCMDTAQEQIRRSLAVGELRMPTLRSWSNASKNPTGGNASSGKMTADGQGESSFSSSQSSGFPSMAPNGSSAANASSFSGVNMQHVMATGGSSANNKLFGNALTSGQLASNVHIWDAVVVSLGAEGLVKCFLWSKPRGGASAPGNVLGSFQWMQESCWVISWADETDDITCSQSTSLKDGDNMNPQTALMRSIKSSYFPLAVHVSPDASLVLFVWKTKWVVLKRKWLCKIEALTSAGSASPRNKNSSKSKPSVPVGSCKIPPAAFLGRGSVEHADGETGKQSSEAVYWENGEFFGDNHVMLWTNTGHVFQFAACGNSMSSAGKLFLFTKDQDQFVPRSNFKNLTVIEKGQYIAFLNQCECCSKTGSKRASTSRSSRFSQLWSVSRESTSGFTSCVQLSSASGSSIPSSPASSPSTQTKLIHMCKRGSLGFWDISSNKYSSPPRMTKSHAFPVHLYDRVRFYSLADGFAGKDGGMGKSVPRENELEKRGERRVCLSHLMLGRDDSGSSCSYGDALRLGKRRRRRRTLQGVDATGASLATAASTGADSPVASVFSTALGTIVARASPSPLEQRRASIGFGGSISEISSRYLMDVPVMAKGFSDGSVEFSLLGRRPAAQGSNLSGASSQVHLPCHTGSVTAVAHCHWVAPSASGIDSSPSPQLPLNRAATVESPGNGASRATVSSGIYMSAKKSKTWKRGTPIEESSLASDRNPFYRSRFPAPVQRRSWSSRNLSVSSATQGGSTSAHNLHSSVSAPSSPSSCASSRSPTSLAVHFMVFTGGEDGVLRVIELTIRPVDSSFVCEATILQRFRKHRGAITEITLSPVRDGGSSWSAQCPERFVATVGIDHKVTLYAPLYGYHPNNRGPAAQSSLKSRCGVEWECILELGEHPDAICDLDWHLERGLLYVECEDRMVYVWNTDTGILERSLPAALLYDGGNAASDDNSDCAVHKKESVESSDLVLGDSSVHLLRFGVIRSAEHIKSSWKSYFYGLSNAEPPILSMKGDQGSPPRPVSPYAIGSIELLLLSFLLSWGATPEIDRACRELLGLDAPHLLYSCALRDGASGALTIPVPWKSSAKYKSRSVSNLFAPSVHSFVRNWQHSSALSANLALGIVSLCMNLMEHKYSKGGSHSQQQHSLTLPSSPKNKEEFHVLWSQLITQHSVVLPDYVPCFREPALEYLAKFGFNPCDYTQLAARALLNGVIKRLPSGSRSTLTAEYSTKLHCEIVRLEVDTGSKLNGSSSGNAIDFALVVSRLGSLVILLSMIGTCYPGEISPAGAREVCDILVYLLKAPAQHIGSVSAELLTKGLMLFRPHLVDLSSLIVQLLLIDMREKQRNPDGSTSPVFGSNARVLANGGSNASLSLLIELGACESAFVLALLQQEMNNNDRPHAFRECVLLYLTELINTHYLLMFRHLPAVVDTIMCCLDPTKPDRRKRCLELSTRCLHNLVRRFPMIDFHKETQRLAIGTMEAVILIYDLRTATKWRVLDGHSSAISAIGFRVDGQILVSYAAREGSVRWWNSGNAGIFGGMLKMQQSCLKEHKLDILKSSSASAPSSSGGASADLKQVIQTCRFQFLTLAEPSIKASNSAAGELKEKKILRLTREDASQVQFLL